MDDEQRLKQQGHELQKFSKKTIYIGPPETGETKKETQIRFRKIRRRIGEAKKKKKVFEREEKELKRCCENAGAGERYDPPNDMEDDDERRKRLRDFILVENELQVACSRARVKYEPPTADEDDIIRRDRLRDKIFESDLKERCKDNGVTYQDPPSQEDKQCAQIRRKVLENLVTRSVRFDVCCLYVLTLHILVLSTFSF